MTAQKIKQTALTDDQIRETILQYLYRRNQNATSRRGKSTGAAVTISVMRADLKASHGLTVQQIHSNLTYLESQGWVKDQPVTKSFTTGTGAVIPSETNYFVITAQASTELEDQACLQETGSKESRLKLPKSD